MKNRYCYKFVLSKVSCMDVCVEEKIFIIIVMFWIKIFFDCILEFFCFELFNLINDLFIVK